MNNYTLHHGDCLDVLPTLEADSVDSVITDPPYGLEFMGKDWDYGVPGARFWCEVLRVAKPGATLLAFGGTRTHHRLMCAIEDAGWEIRDVIMWVYGSGFPKSHDISKAIDRAAGAKREVVGDNPNRAGRHYQTIHDGWKRPWQDDSEASALKLTAPATEAAHTWDGWGTALKPAWEPIIVAMKPRDGTFAHNALTHGVAGLWIDGGRVGTEDTRCFKKGGGGKTFHGQTEIQRISGSAKGRWPANLIHDGSAEVVELFPESGGGARPSRRNVSIFGNGSGTDDGERIEYGTGSAARFFYCAKASRSERNAGCDGLKEREGASTSNGGRPGKAMTVGAASLSGKPNPPPKTRNHHPTIKPLALMRYLCRITKTPTGGVVLDPFMGSGSTGCAAIMEGRDFVGIEQNADYVEIARCRIEHAEREHTERVQHEPQQLGLEHA